VRQLFEAVAGVAAATTIRRVVEVAVLGAEGPGAEDRFRECPGLLTLAAVAAAEEMAFREQVLVVVVSSLLDIRGRDGVLC